ncbi:hypothetical protein KKJ06_21175 [Xenorhabdus bovienii]|uniref:hypothetical protein n=1 Tax=Xenorhabdus bovienii TaxID=40576 RepID=UPI0023B251B3|nr:hypothetical protein [Xenorhabdus bovienii]MDE9557843.1 hypothetical protein [Xenorhabdus bovienii]
MNIENSIREIRIKCDEILSFNMWFNFHESFFWPIIELIDVDEDFLTHLYSSIEDKYLEILFHEPVIISVVESVQSDKLIDCIRNMRDEKPDLIDDILIQDIESALFVNYDEPENYLSAQRFKDTYMALKKLIKEALDKEQCNVRIINTLDLLIEFSEKNKHEYFSYVRVYWLSLYFYKSSSKLKNQDEIEYYKSALSKLFPCGSF